MGIVVAVKGNIDNVCGFVVGEDSDGDCDIGSDAVVHFLHV